MFIYIYIYSIDIYIYIYIYIIVIDILGFFDIPSGLTCWRHEPIMPSLTTTCVRVATMAISESGCWSSSTACSLRTQLEMVFWLVVEPTHLKNMKVSWDDYSKYMEQSKNVPNHQPVLSLFWMFVAHQIFLPPLETWPCHLELICTGFGDFWSVKL